MSISVPVTIAVLIGMIVLGLHPKIPVWAKILVQVILAVGIYVGLSDAMFALPYGDSLPISDMFGGSGGQPGFNKMSMGVVSGVLGILASLLAFAIGKVLAGRSEPES